MFCRLSGESKFTYFHPRKCNWKHRLQISDIVSWWRHQMKTFCRVTSPLWGESTGLLTMTSDVELWCFFDLRLYKRLSKYSDRRWFEVPSRSLWRHCNVLLRRSEWNAKIWNFTPLYFLPYHLSKVMAAMNHGNVKARWNTGMWEQEWYWRWTLAMKWKCHVYPHRKF